MVGDRCLVIGGSGFLGSHLCRALTAQGYEVNVLSRRTKSTSSSKLLTFFKGNLQDRDSLEAAIEGCKLVYHLGSSSIPSTSNLDPKSDIHLNLEGTLNLIETALKVKVAKIIFASSGGTVYGIQQAMPVPETAPTNPICSYGIVKLAIEKYLHMYHSLYGLDYCILRIANPFGIGQGQGTRQGAIVNFITKYLQGANVEVWGDGSVVRDYIYVDDVITAFLQVADYMGEFKVFNIGTGTGRSIVQVLDSIENVLNCSIARTYKPPRSLDVPQSILDISLAATHLAWKPAVSWEDGLEKTYLWLQKMRQR